MPIEVDEEFLARIESQIGQTYDGELHITEADARALISKCRRLLSAKFWTRTTYPDGMSAEQVQDELHDLHMILENVPKVYSHITGGMLSKPHYTADGVIQAADDYMKQQFEELIDDAKEGWLAELKEIASKHSSGT